MLSSPVFANPYLRPASSPTTLRVLSALCVKNPPFASCHHAVSHKTSLIITYDRSTQVDVSCTLLHQNANSTHLFSTRCALFCNYGGGGGWGSRVSGCSRGHSGQREVCPPRRGSAFSLLGRLLFLYFRLSISFRSNTYGPTPRFTVFWPKSPADNSFRINTSRTQVCNSFRSNAYRKSGEGPSPKYASNV
jgi:hypothetical protein